MSCQFLDRQFLDCVRVRDRDMVRVRVRVRVAVQELIIINNTTPTCKAP